jgi:asparagine synthase (glutamine-hydrolysing)
MCGIAGIYSFAENFSPIKLGSLHGMMDQMIARGPDASGGWLSKDMRVGLGHRRLSIIDLTESGNQPMGSYDGRYQIVFNGEIYNYLELRHDLLARGIQFHGHSDTEVVLQLYILHREHACKKLRGMFSFAVWDNQLQELFLARDTFGIKPLYFSESFGVFYFASQVKALLVGQPGLREIDPAGFVGFHIWGHIPDPFTLYKGIKSLDPGSWMKIERGGKMLTGIFESLYSIYINAPQIQSKYIDLNDALEDSVSHHMISDVPVGVFLSAGIDSAVLVALASQYGPNLRTITLAFKEYIGTSQDESKLARDISNQYGTQHETFWFDKSMFQTLSRQFFYDMDQPSTDGLNTWLVAYAAKSAGIKVALSGLGGDEFFGGYPSFSQIPLMRSVAKKLSFAPSVGRLFRKLSSPFFQQMSSIKYAGIFEFGSSLQGAYMLRRGLYMPWELKNGLNIMPSETNNFIQEGLDRLLELDKAKDLKLKEIEQEGGASLAISYLEADQYMRSRLLRDSDWAGMAHSVEIRVPYVDKNLVQYLAAAALNGVTYKKRDLALSPKRGLPQSIIDRPKTGFSVPIRDWLMTDDGNFKQRGLRDWGKVVYKNYISSVK